MVVLTRHNKSTGNEHLLLIWNLKYEIFGIYIFSISDIFKNNLKHNPIQMYIIRVK